MRVDGIVSRGEGQRVECIVDSDGAVAVMPFDIAVSTIGK
jgi:hypothetical protein